MLAKALQEHNAAPIHKAPTLSQTLFPSSSPLSGHDAFRNPSQRTNRSTNTSTSGRFQLGSGNVLKPSASAVLNAPGSGWQAGANNPLKRTAAQANGMGSLLSKQDSILSKENVIDLTQSTYGADRVGKLHDAVYFDENDFDDDVDLDLDFDVEDPKMKGHLSAAKTQPTLPTVSHPPPVNHQEISSQPLPWSSSPLQRKTAPQPESVIDNAAPSPVLDLTYTEMPQALPKPPVARPSKRRTLPWLDADGQEATAEPRRELPAHVQKIIDRKKANQINRQRDTHQGLDVEAFTPLPKDKPNSPYPWNKTASAVKEEQKNLRKANVGKKVVKNNGVDDGNAKDTITGVKKKKGDVAGVFLSDEQQKVLKMVVEGQKSVFFTGSAGTGKSVLLRQIIAALRKKHSREPDRVAVTASTGLAACNVGGVTLHSFGGIGLGKEAIPDLVKKIKRNAKAKQRWLRTKVLIVDEISMVDGDLFDKLEGIARSIRNNGRPFGGIQLVITGDFFQLPPVPDYGKVAKFAFDAATWNTSIDHTIGLTQIFRQKDPVFANVLNEMRLGKLTPKSINIFRSLNRPLGFTDDVEATELFPTRQEVENANNLRMRNLAGTPKEFRAIDGGSITDLAQRDKLLSSCMAPPNITLKKGSQVMLIKNIDDTLVNGSLGKVAGFMDERTFDYYHENEEDFQAVETMDLGDEEMNRSRKRLKEMLSKDLVGDTSRVWPVVRFAIADGSSRDLLCQNEVWKIELPSGEVQASRSQIPLILAWALSIHKAQGQTLERVKVDLGRIFEKGQAYVALSRATCQEGLQILRFDPKKVMAHEKVRSFYESLYNVDQASKAVAPAAPSKPRTTLAKSYEQGFMHGAEDFEDEDALQQMYA